MSQQSHSIMKRRNFLSIVSDWSWSYFLCFYIPYNMYFFKYFNVLFCLYDETYIFTFHLPVWHLVYSISQLLIIRTNKVLFTFFSYFNLAQTGSSTAGHSIGLHFGSNKVVGNIFNFRLGFWVFFVRISSHNAVWMTAKNTK